MDYPEGAGSQRADRVTFDPRVRLEFCGTQLSSDGGLLVVRELWPRQQGHGCRHSRRGGLSQSQPELSNFLELAESMLKGRSAHAGFRVKRKTFTPFGLRRMPKARVFIENRQLELHNNICERSIRPVTLSRKTYLFMGSKGGGEAAAIAYTLIETARMNNMDPEAWLCWVLGRVADHKMSRLERLCEKSLRCYPADHLGTCGDHDERLGCLHPKFVILRHSAMTAEPSKAALDDPIEPDNLERLLLALDDDEFPAVSIFQVLR